MVKGDREKEEKGREKGERKEKGEGERREDKGRKERREGRKERRRGRKERRGGGKEKGTPCPPPHVRPVLAGMVLGLCNLECLCQPFFFTFFRGLTTILRLLSIMSS